MEACKNRNSGKNFICLEELPNNKYLLITPLGTIKSLESNLFETPITVSDDDDMFSQSIADSQKNIYRMYLKSTEEELNERFEMYLEELTPQEKYNLKILLQQQYPNNFS